MKFSHKDLGFVGEVTSAQKVILKEKSGEFLFNQGMKTTLGNTYAGAKEKKWTQLDCQTAFQEKLEQLLNGEVVGKSGGSRNPVEKAMIKVANEQWESKDLADRKALIKASALEILGRPMSVDKDKKLKDENRIISVLVRNILEEYHDLIKGIAERRVEESKALAAMLSVTTSKLVDAATGEDEEDFEDNEDSEDEDEDTEVTE